ncbi:hypothetical protein WN48_06266 [Eufriesea mexicana]|nr:hypothetical protein WN48_06266 [Eufriesea mexicana]
MAVHQHGCHSHGEGTSTVDNQQAENRRNPKWVSLRQVFTGDCFADCLRGDSRAEAVTGSRLSANSRDARPWPPVKHAKKRWGNGLGSGGWVGLCLEYQDSCSEAFRYIFLHFWGEFTPRFGEEWTQSGLEPNIRSFNLRRRLGIQSRKVSPNVDRLRTGVQKAIPGPGCNNTVATVQHYQANTVIYRKQPDRMTTTMWLAEQKAGRNGAATAPVNLATLTSSLAAVEVARSKPLSTKVSPEQTAVNGRQTSGKYDKKFGWSGKVSKLYSVSSSLIYVIVSLWRNGNGMLCSVKIRWFYLKAMIDEGSVGIKRNKNEPSNASEWGDILCITRDGSRVWIGLDEDLESNGSHCEPNVF